MLASGVVLESQGLIVGPHVFRWAVVYLAQMHPMVGKSVLLAHVSLSWE